MRKLLYCTLAVALCLGPAYAGDKEKGDEKGGDKGKAACAEVKATVAKGTIETLDAAAGKLSIKTKKGEIVEVVCTAATVIKKGRTVYALSDLSIGDTVQAKCKGTECVNITVKKAAKKPAPVEKAEKGKKDKKEAK